MALNGFLSAGCGVFHEHPGRCPQPPKRKDLFDSEVSIHLCLHPLLLDELEVKHIYGKVVVMEQISSAPAGGGGRRGQKESQRQEEPRTKDRVSLAHAPSELLPPPPVRHFLIILAYYESTEDLISLIV